MNKGQAGKGPLHGVKILELAGIGPGPFCAMLLADMGAELVRIERKGAERRPSDVCYRSRRSLTLNLKHPAAVETFLRLVEKADGLQEGFRPGVMERLGLGPDVCLARNPRLVYGRMTGWGQDGPLSQAAGHDINYIALSGALDAIGDAGRKPSVPLNLIGDFGGGALYLALGMCAALLHAHKSGEGQVVDCAMTEGAASLMSMFYGFAAAGIWQPPRGTNLLDGGAHFYDCYETKDGEYVALGAIEPQFYALLREKLGLEGDTKLDAQMDRKNWPELKKTIATAVKQKTRAELDALLLGSDACYAPVLSMKDAPHHPHNKARQAFVEVDGVVQPAPAPRFSHTPTPPPGPVRKTGADNDEVLSDWGFDDKEIAQLVDAGAL